METREEVPEELVDPEATGDPSLSGPDAGGGGAGPAQVANRRTQAQNAISNPSADTKQAALVGGQIRPQSTDYRNGNPNSWVGVTKDAITLAPGYDVRSCGADLVAVISAAGGALPTQNRYYRPAPKNSDETRRQTEETTEALMKFFNDRGWDGFDQYPHLKPLRDKFGTPQRPFYGRRLVHKTFDSGSFQCPEQTTSAATVVADEIKAFSAFVDRWDGTPTNMANALSTVPANRRPMMFGTLWLTDSNYTKWAPYVWTQFSSGSTIVNQNSSWICSRLVGKKAANTRDFKERTRKFGLIYPNRVEDKQRVAEFKAGIERHCGKPASEIIEPGAEAQYTFDISRAGAEGAQIMQRMQTAGVTSIIMMADPVIPLFQINQARGNGYHPEYIFSSIGYADSNTVQRIYDLDFGSGMGLSQLGVYGGFGYGAGDPFWAWHHSHRTAPDGKPCDPRSNEGMGAGRGSAVEEYCKAPTQIATYYYTVLPLIGGIVFAGPDLTPANVSKGLQAYPMTRYGGSGPTSDPRPALVGAGPGKYNFVIDAVEWRWRLRYRSPYPENKAEGWVQYMDCQRHYLLWPDKLALNWERNGPNYNAWCGDAKYAPENSAEKDGYPRITEGQKPS